MAENSFSRPPLAKYHRAEIFHKIQKTIDKFRMLEKGDKVLIAFSAGPDSSALLFLLNELRQKYKISLCACHVNHMLRGKEAGSDEREAKRICRKLKIPCSIVKKNIKKLKKRGESIEESARRIRYEALMDVAQEFNADKIALGHNKNDQVETILLRIIRGAGEDGLKGIPPVRDLRPGLKLIRPLIEVKRQEIEKYLNSRKFKPRIDSSNFNVRFLRNRVRHELIPELKKLNPKIEDNLLKIAQLAKGNSDYIRLNTHSILKQVSTKLPHAIRIDLDKLLVYPKVLCNYVLREAIKTIMGEFKNINYSNLEEIHKIINSRRANLVLCLPYGLKMEKEYNSLFIKRAGPSKTPAKNNGNYYIFKQEGEFRIPEIGKTICIDYIGQSYKTLPKFDDSSIIYLNADEIKFPLLLRTRNKGDRFFPFGMKKAKKLKDFFIDEKIPLRKRNRISVLADDAGRILWIVGYRRSNIGVIDKHTNRICRIRMK